MADVSSGYCPECGQDNTSGVHEDYCPGKPELREGRTFKEWKRLVNRAVVRIAGVSVDDLADSNFWDEWNAGTTPEEMANQVLEENDFPFDEV